MNKSTHKTVGIAALLSVITLASCSESKIKAPALSTTPATKTVSSPQYAADMGISIVQGVGCGGTAVKPSDGEMKIARSISCGGHGESLYELGCEFLHRDGNTDVYKLIWKRRESTSDEGTWDKLNPKISEKEVRFSGDPILAFEDGAVQGWIYENNPKIQECIPDRFRSQ